MPSVYIETTVISYLVARISSDLVTAAHQLANAQMKWRIERTCRAAGCIAPVVCTPEQLMEDL